MKQQNSRLVTEVNKLICNSLVKDGGLFLPEIGSLSVTTTPPSMGGVKGGASAPSRTVKFSSEESYRSLILTISERGNCTPQQATMIYAKWRESSCSNEGVSIEGVGKIADNTFTPSDSIIAKLNPVTIGGDESNKSGATASKKGAKGNKGNGGKSKIAMIAIAALVAVAAVVGIFICSDDSDSSIETKPTQTEAITEIPEATINESDSTSTIVAEPAPAPQAEPEMQPEPKPEPIVKEVESDSTVDEAFDEAFERGRSHLNLPYKVVYGAFSTKKNAVKAMQLAGKLTNGAVECTIYNHGKSYIVSLLDTADPAEAQAFVNKYRDVINESLWIHKR